ncbi:MAG: DHH family phosphoesterase [Candidatus Portnoybacteria bacterium]|nr:DHH family phosphoesterase [Candidatus Portnoybacteria bacterium]
MAKWNIKPKAPEEFIKKFPEYPPLVLQLLYDRGLDTQEKIDEFFNPDYLGDLHDPFLMLGMKEAVGRITKAIAQKEKIVVFADYDCDGVCGGVILGSALKALGANLGNIYIPDRHIEGFGLNKKAVKEIKERGANLIITVDCGITNKEEAQLAKELGMEVIITDHHEEVAGKKLETIVIDPHQKGDKYPFCELAGAGVAFKLAQALLKELKSSGVADGWEKWLLDLVALATVADMVPLLGENRTIVKYGLVVLAQTRRPGLKALMKEARLNPVLEKRATIGAESMGKMVSHIETGRYSFFTNLSSHTLGFILGPRINAASSLAHANIAYELLSTDLDDEAERIANQLEEINRSKYELIEKIIFDAEERLKQKPMGRIIFEASDKWPIGVVRWAAQRLKDKYSRPTFLFNITDSQAKGSIRSIEQFNVVEAMEQCGGLLEKFGGHPCSAGCRLAEENLEKFKTCLDKIAEKKLKEEDLEPTLDIDYQVEAGDVDWRICDLVQGFAPFGQANSSPLFLLSGVEIASLRTVGNEDKHLKLELRIMNYESGEQKSMQAIGFNHGVRYDELKIGDRIDIVFEFSVNGWNGNRELELKVIDLKKTEARNPKSETDSPRRVILKERSD